MNFNSINNPLIILTVLLTINGISSLSIINNDDTRSSDTENVPQNDNNSNKYNYSLTDAEPVGVDKIDFYDFDRMERTCCSLARIAAQRGLFCNLKFYQNKLLYRIANRTHRKHIQLIGNGREQLINRQLMVKISKCYDGFTNIFEYCCWDEVDKEFEY